MMSMWLQDIFRGRETQSCSPVNDEVKVSTAAAKSRSPDIVFPLDYPVLSVILKIGICLPSVYVSHLHNQKVILLTQ